MEKTLTIDGRKITFKKSGATMLRYRRQTGREFYSDLSAFLSSVDVENVEKSKVSAKQASELLQNFQIDYMYDMLHVMAREFDKNIPSDLLDWLEEFNEFPVIQIFIELIPMLMSELSVTAKNELAEAVKEAKAIQN